MDEIQQAKFLLDVIDRQVNRAWERQERQSHTIRELARFLSENGIAVSRFTQTTQETLVAVALNGDY